VLTGSRSNLNGPKGRVLRRRNTLTPAEIDEGNKAFSRYIIMKKLVGEEIELLKGDIEEISEKQRKVQDAMRLYRLIANLDTLLT
jgi:hypothetical protein